MWRELITNLPVEAEIAEPASAADVDVIETQLGQTVPADLKALLLETNGVVDQYGTDVVWPAEKIAAENADFRTRADFNELYMPFIPLMFFGDNGGGDQFAFVRQPERTDVFVWEHETDSRRMVTGTLEQYVVRALESEGEDWYQQ